MGDKPGSMEEEVGGILFPGEDRALEAGVGVAGGLPLEGLERRRRLVSEIWIGGVGKMGKIPTPPDPLNSPDPASPVVPPRLAVVPPSRYLAGPAVVPLRACSTWDPHPQRYYR